MATAISSRPPIPSPKIKRPSLGNSTPSASASKNSHSVSSTSFSSQKPATDSKQLNGSRAVVTSPVVVNGVLPKNNARRASQKAGENIQRPNRTSRQSEAFLSARKPPESVPEPHGMHRVRLFFCAVLIMQYETRNISCANSKVNSRHLSSIFIQPIFASINKMVAFPIVPQ